MPGSYELWNSFKTATLSQYVTYSHNNGYQISKSIQTTIDSCKY